ncbi:hypothetical protein YC2023_023171 [Brassica napus]
MSPFGILRQGESWSLPKLHGMLLLDVLLRCLIHLQAEWKPESPDRSVRSLHLSSHTRISSEESCCFHLHYTKCVWYRPPHANHAAAIQAEILRKNLSIEMSKNALKNKKKREKKKAAEAAASGANNA